ncbi:phosphotransferase [Aliiroseovarius subalbicans]|uniref:phosphotransferase n=1 Tax=Aliiroseovarius subalbicans TaxID=2925840 RepID=UPI001F583816|nr:phosphotransferase [Aliiroseovarius subalbicans]MCI2398992.1 phosphotransferase [Aliiroseovarius subalbicans]
MIEGLEIEPRALGAYLEDHVEGFHGLRTCEKFAAGQSNPTYRVEAASGCYVLRAKPPGKLLKSAHAVEREFRVMAALEGTEVAVPRVFHLAEDDASPIGRAFFVMEHLDGRIFWDPALPEVGRDARGAIYDAMNATLAALHSVDVTAVGLSDYGRPGNYFARQLERWSGQYRASALTPRPQMDALITWLEEALPPDDGQVALVHGDYRMDNMMFAPQAPRVIGLLDWELSTLGHPLADLAYQCMQWRLPHDAGMRGLGGLDRAALGLPGEAEYVATYAARRGIGAVDDWAFHLAFAFFRLAAILEGVVRRAHDGNASNPDSARAYASAIPVLAALALEVIEEGT